MPVIPPKKTALEKIEAAIAKCRAEIVEKKRRLERLKSAADVLREIEEVGPAQDLADKKIRECAIAILKEKSPRHFKQIANEAIERGYKSQKGGERATIIQSFWSVMNRHEEDFEQVGEGMYRLRERAGKD